MLPEDIDSLKRFAPVTEATRRDLETFVRLLRSWQGTHNLVGPGTLGAIWSRHVADSLQLLEHAPRFRRWVDLGSGAGFPGLVVAIARKERPDIRVTLVEANGKKAAFLRAAIRATGAPAEVAAERIERHGPRFGAAADIVSARALAPLSGLIGLAQPYLHAGSTLLLLKGRDFVREVDEASKSWNFDVLDSPSATDPDGRVLTIRNVSRKAPRA